MTDFKTFCDLQLENFNLQKTKKDQISKNVCKTFGIVPHTFRSRFKSIYGRTLTEMCYTLEVPPKDLLTKLILESDDVNELWSKVHVPKDRRAKIFAETYGVSTFARAKGICLLYSENVKYNPTLDDNMSIAVSQYFGDGCWVGKRGIFQIAHGEKQRDYLYFKASLFNKAWPTTKPAGNTKKYLHTQGHTYYSWYSGVLPSKIKEFLNTASKVDLMSRMTPLGVLLYLLDDGYMNLDTTRQGNAYMLVYIHDLEVLKLFRDMLGEYGIHTTLSGQNVCIQDMVNAVRLYKNFIQPFEHMLPECMQYKTKMKI